MPESHTVAGSAPLEPAEPVFDAEVLNGLFVGEPGVVAAVLDTFATSMVTHLDQLQQEMAHGDALAAAMVAHRIKGAARMSGATALAQAAERLERDARAHAAAHGGYGCNDLLHQWQRLQQSTDYCRARQKQKDG